MILTRLHVQFFREQKVPRPSWAPAITRTHFGVSEVPVNIHALINAQVPERKTHRTEPHNLIHLVKLVQGHKQETVKAFLYRLATEPCGTDPKRRTGYARKWYAKLTRIL
jgi:hypothetical protein